jgi:hypothetical protein
MLHAFLFSGHFDAEYIGQGRNTVIKLNKLSNKLSRPCSSAITIHSCDRLTDILTALVYHLEFVMWLETSVDY